MKPIISVLKTWQIIYVFIVSLIMVKTENNFLIPRLLLVDLTVSVVVV